MRETGLLLKFSRLARETAMKRALSKAGFNVRRIEREEYHKLTTIKARRPKVEEQRTIRHIRRDILKAFRTEGLRLRPDFLTVWEAGAQIQVTLGMLDAT